MTITTPVGATVPTDFRPSTSGPDARLAVREAVTFVAITFVVVTALAVLLPGTKENPGPVSLLTLITPGIMLGLIRLLARLRHGRANPYPFGLRRVGLRSWPAAVLLPVACIGSSFAVAAALGVVTFDGLVGYVLSSPINIVTMTVLLLGEEIPWRGYLLPRVASVLPVRQSTLVTGFIQSLYHLPLLLITVAYDSDGSRWIVVPGVVVVITLGGVLFGWLRIRSQSLWPVLIAHATVNTCLVEAPVLMSHNADLAAYLTGEGGLFTVIGVAIVAGALLKFADWNPRAAKERTSKRHATPVSV